MNVHSFQNSILLHDEKLMAGNIDPIIPCYKEVIPVFVESNTILIEGHDTLRETILNLRKRLEAEGVTRVVGKLAIDERMGNGSFLFSVDWQYYSGECPTPNISTTSYYCVCKYGLEKIEMVEYKRVAFPNIIGRNGLNIAPNIADKVVVPGYLH